MSSVIGVIVRGSRNIFLVLPIEKYNLFLQEDTCPEQVYEHCIECRIKGKRGKITNSTIDLNNFLMAGDKVYFEYIDNNYGVITKSIQRENSLLRIRKDMHHCMAVNIDAIMSVVSVKKPEFNTVFFDKMVCLSLLERLPIIMVINKMDLLVEKYKQKYKNSNTEIVQSKVKDLHNAIPLQELFPESICLRINILSQYIPHLIHFSFTSTLFQQNKLLSHYSPIHLKQHLAGKSVAVLGHSGVGKSSLLNSLYPTLQRRVSVLSIKYKEGRHTTTMPELCFCDGYVIVDTPGIRNFVPSQLPATSVILAFPEFEQHARQCKLPNCSHREEPGCMVLPQVGKSIVTQRYESYTKFRSEIEFYEENLKKVY